MAELPADLAAAVHKQAQARVDMNIQGYAKYLKPEAVDTLRASFPGMPPRVTSFEVEQGKESNDEQTVDVHYRSRDTSFVVRSRWRRENGGCMVVHAERLWAEDEKRPGLVSRIVATLLRPLASMRRR